MPQRNEAAKLYVQQEGDNKNEKSSLEDYIIQTVSSTMK